MNRRPILVSILVCFVAVSAVAAGSTSHIPKANTRDAIVAYVQDAAKVVQKNGSSCATFASADWRSGDFYIFVAGPDQKTLCHPDPAIVGKAMSEIVNSKGDKVGEKIARTAAGDGKGWVDYLWTRPGKKTEEPKSTYVIGVTGSDGKHYIVGSGAWDLKK